ncbi:MAG: DUF5689 domain-containing protein [Alistipes senegalensis]|nr:DUF5689 domain-containing protein [Bacteroides cellulosilyticus]MCM1351732.1 DUF5689 domain-containing protein [Alistipes senegalensis]
MKISLFAATIATVAGAAVAFLTACHDGPFDPPPPADNPLPATTTIADVRRLLDGNAVTVTNDIAVCGTVTTSDSRYNFYRSLCIESDGAALEFLAGVDRLHVDYPVGCRVTVLLRGLTIGTYRGVLQVGAKSDTGSYYPTTYLASPAAVAAHLVRWDETLQPVEPTSLRIGDLTSSRCGMLVRIDGLHFVPDTESDAADPASPETDPSLAATWAGTHRFCDASGAAIYSYVRSNADFADTAIPSGEGSLVGILQSEGSGTSARFLIKLRDENDFIP